MRNVLALTRVLFEVAVAFWRVKGRGKPVGRRMYEMVTYFRGQSSSTTIDNLASELFGSLADLLCECKPIDL
jgi:hypothetical protein